MDIIIDGRGTLTLALEAGDLTVTTEEGVMIFRTKGDPRKPNNPSFASFEDALAYFNTLPLSQPVPVAPEEEEAPQGV